MTAMVSTQKSQDDFDFNISPKNTQNKLIANFYKKNLFNIIFLNLIYKFAP